MDRVTTVDRGAEDSVIDLRLALIGIERVIPLQGIRRAVNVGGVKYVITLLDMQLERINGVTTATGSLQAIVEDEITKLIRRYLRQLMSLTIPEILQVLIDFAVCNPMIFIVLTNRVVFQERGTIYRHKGQIHVVDVAAQGLLIFEDRLHVFQTAGTVVDLLVIPQKRIVHTKHGIELVVTGRYDMQIQHIDGVKSMRADLVVDRIIDIAGPISVNVVIFPPVPSCIGAYRSLLFETIGRKDEDGVMDDRVATVNGLERIYK